MRKARLLPRVLLELVILCVAVGALVHAAAAQPAAEAAALREQQRLPILMYHSVLKDPSRAGDYVVSPDTLEADLAYLKSNGYESVVMADVIAYVEGKAALPRKPVMITFDDGYYNNLVYVLPLLTQYDMRAVLSVVGCYTERFTQTPDPNPNYGHLSWTELRELQDTGRFEIQNHSYDMHGLGERQGSSKRRDESESAYRRAFFEDTERMRDALQEHGLAASTYTYPYGAIGPNTTEYLREMGFSASLSCFERINVLSVGDADCLFCLGRYNRPSGLSTLDFMARVFKEER